MRSINLPRRKGSLRALSAMSLSLVALASCSPSSPEPVVSVLATQPLSADSEPSGHTIFGAETPEQPDVTDDDPRAPGRARKYELGTRFVPAVDGNIRGLRYWRSPSETNPVTESSAINFGRLWTSEGKQIAALGFQRAASLSGWQYAYFAAPVPVVGGTEYVASVYADSHYAVTVGGLASGAGEGDVRAVPGGGVFGLGGRFPTETYADSNYFRDVIFERQVDLVAVTRSLPTAYLAEAYAQTLLANGGARPYRWRVSGGSLPVGISLSDDGQLAGFPGRAATVPITFTVTDANGAEAQLGPISFAVTALPSFVTTTLQNARVGEEYSQTLRVVAGAPPYTFEAATLVSGGSFFALFISSDGQFVGTPQVAGDSVVRFGATDANGRKASIDIALHVDPASAP